MRLHLKHAFSVSGEPCCPACKSVMPLNEPICRHCGFDVRTGKTFKPRPPRSLNWARLLAPIRFVFRVVLFSVVLIVAAWAVTFGFEQWTTYKQSLQRSPSTGTGSPPARMCRVCQGMARISCAKCGGDGRIEGQKRTKMCSQCQGSGVFKKRLSKSTVKCPFCKGSGVADEYFVQETCPACQGRGMVVCAACIGGR